MKKQLLVLSALFVAVSAQASMYERMKAAAKEKYDAAKASIDFNKVKTSAQQAVQSNLPAIKNTLKEPVAGYLETAMKLAASQARAAGVPESVIDQGKAVVAKGYESQFGALPAKDTASSGVMSAEDMEYMEMLKNQQN